MFNSDKQNEHQQHQQHQQQHNINTTNNNNNSKNVSFFVSISESGLSSQAYKRSSTFEGIVNIESFSLSEHKK